MGVLDGKVALVTGGNMGIGRGIALAFASEGAKLVICGRTEDALNGVRQEIEARGAEVLALPCDISRQEGREQLVNGALERFGTIDILVNNATYTPRGQLLEISDEDVHAAWQAGPFAALKLMKMCHPHLKNGGSIINISSGVSVSGYANRRGIYAMVKSALNTVSRAAANEWGPDGIRVNVIMPMAMTHTMAGFMQNEPEQAKKVVDAIPLRRVGDAEKDIGRVAVFLAGPDASYLTGTVLTPDGGTVRLG